MARSIPSTGCRPNGTAILIAAVLAILLLRLKPAVAVQTLGETFKELALPIYSIGMVLAFAFVARTTRACPPRWPWRWPIRARPLRSSRPSWAGSAYSSRARTHRLMRLFGALQATTAAQLGLPEVLAVTANTTGGVTGKMISPKSIAIACAAVGLAGKESDLFRFTVKHSLAFTGADRHHLHAAGLCVSVDDSGH